MDVGGVGGGGSVGVGGVGVSVGGVGATAVGDPAGCASVAVGTTGVDGRAARSGASVTITVDSRGGDAGRVNHHAAAPATTRATATRTPRPPPFASTWWGASGGGAVSAAARVFIGVSFVSLPHSGQWNRSPRWDAGIGAMAPHHGQSKVRWPDVWGASGGGAVGGRSLVFVAVSFVLFLHSGHGKCSPR